MAFDVPVGVDLDLHDGSVVRVFHQYREGPVASTSSSTLFPSARQDRRAGHRGLMADVRKFNLAGSHAPADARLAWRARPDEAA